MLLLAAACRAGGATDATSGTGPLPAPRRARSFDELVGGLRVATSPSGRVVVIGRVPVENLQVSQWAEDVVERVGAVTGLPGPFDRRRPLTVELDASPAAAPSATPADRGRRLIVAEFARLPADAAHAALCRCVLSDAMPAPADAVGEPAAAVPGWLVCGVARSLYAPRRAEDGSAVLAAWEAGALDTLAAFLDRMIALGAGEPPDPLDRARSAFVVAWLAAGGASRSEAFARCLSVAARGGESGWAGIGPMLGGGFTAASLEEAWDRRVLRERRVVAQPGRTSPEGVRRFRAALLIYPGLSGMPLSDEPYRTLDWPSLLALRDEPWMRAFCERKSNCLRMAAVGRGEATLRAADAYCEVLAAIREGRSERRLRRLLADAVEAEAALVAAEEAGGQAGGTAGR